MRLNGEVLGAQTLDSSDLLNSQQTMIRHYWKLIRFMCSNNTVRAVWMGITALVIILFLSGCIIISTRPLPNEIGLNPSPKVQNLVRFSFHPEEITGETNDGKAPMGVLPIEPAL